MSESFFHFLLRDQSSTNRTVIKSIHLGRKQVTSEMTIEKYFTRFGECLRIKPSSTHVQLRSGTQGGMKVVVDIGMLSDEAWENTAGLINRFEKQYQSNIFNNLLIAY